MKRKIHIGIIDYKIGNINSCSRALQTLGFKSSLISQPSEIYKIDLILLPGVGSFHLAMKSLKQNSMDQSIIKAFNYGIPIVGICLGMQLLANDSTENQYTEGLGLIPGSIKPISLDSQIHIGWNRINTTEVIFEPLEKYNSKFVYFNHEYGFVGNKKYVIGHTSIKEDLNIVSAIKNKNVLGFQFHPEKSQKIGHQLLKDSINFLCKKR